MVFLGGIFPLLGISISDRNAEGRIQSVGALGIVMHEILGATNGFVGHLGFIIAQASAVQEARSTFILGITLVSQFVSHSSLLLVRNGVEGLGGKTDSLESHRVLREVVGDEQEGLCSLTGVAGFLVVASGTQDTLDSKGRRSVLLGQHHKGFSSLLILVSLFVSHSGFEHGLVSKGYQRVALHQSQVSLGTFFVTLGLDSLFSLLEEHGRNSLLNFLGHGVVLGGLHIVILLVQPFEFHQSFVQLI